MKAQRLTYIALDKELFLLKVTLFMLIFFQNYMPKVVLKYQILQTFYQAQKKMSHFPISSLKNFQTLMNFYEKMKNDVDIKIANKVFLNRGLAIKLDYITDLTKYFKSGIESVLFKNSSGAAKIINDFVDETTEGLIDKIVDSGSLSDLTR